MSHSCRRRATGLNWGQGREEWGLGLFKMPAEDLVTDIGAPSHQHHSSNRNPVTMEACFIPSKERQGPFFNFFFFFGCAIACRTLIP